MSMTERVRKLRQQSLEAPEAISSERAALMTDFYLSRRPASSTRCSVVSEDTLVAMM